MEMPGRRSNYTLLSQIPDVKLQADTGLYTESVCEEQGSNKGMLERPFEFDVAEHRMWAGSAFPLSNGVQRQSSGSSFGESSLSGDYYFPTASIANEADAFGYMNDDLIKSGGDGAVNGVESRAKGSDSATGGSSSRSWAQQTEESYQLQLALALRLSLEASRGDDPNFLDSVPDEFSSRKSAVYGSADALSHRFWVNGCLSYNDKIPDGFYSIHGMDPYIWTLCTDTHENGRIPSIDSLRCVESCENSSTEVVVIDPRSDPSLKDLQNRALAMSCSCINRKEIVDQLSRLVCHHMGGPAFSSEDGLAQAWKECKDNLKDCFGSFVLPIGSISVGICRHRALLFKVLADTLDLPCRIAKGCKYCTRNDASSCVVRFGADRYSSL